MKLARLSAKYIFLLTVLAGCNARDKLAEDTEKYFNGLNDNQARIITKLEGKPFYADESVFSGQVIISKNVLNVTLTDQFDGRTIINLAADKWYSSHPVSAVVENYKESATSFKMGKIVDRQRLVGAGYMLTKGSITAVAFRKDKMIFKIRGEVAKYSDFRNPDQYLPFEGLIVYRKPAVSMGDINEKEVFGSTHSK